MKVLSMTELMSKHQSASQAFQNKIKKLMSHVRKLHDVTEKVEFARKGHELTKLSVQL